MTSQGNMTEAILMAAGPAGFGCFLVPQGGISAFADSARLGRFSMGWYGKPVDGRPFKSAYRDLKSWLREAIKQELPSPATPVCYGGNFAVKTSNIMAKTHVWPALTRSLTRAVSLEEGHLAERSWAGLLMDVTQIDLQSVWCATGRS